MKPIWSRVSLIFLLYIACVGTIMRAFPFFDIAWEYDHILHSHSHVAFQGWIYTIMILLLSNFYLDERQIVKGKYPLQFKLTVVIIIGVMISFLFQGYGLFSIAFSTLFQILNYWFIYRFIVDSKLSASYRENDISLKFVVIGLWFGVLSTLAPWAIGILSAKGMAGSEAYQSAIYFFLHFQYNGWFLFVVLGLIYKLLENDGVEFYRKKAKMFLVLFGIAVIPSYALSLLGMSFRDMVFIPAVVASILQIAGIVFLFLSIRSKVGHWLANKTFLFKVFILVGFVSFIIKIGLQFLSVFPYFEKMAFESRDIIMAYVHLSLIGVVSFLFIAILISIGWIKKSVLSRKGLGLFMAGFLVSESILVLNGINLLEVRGILLVFSFVMALGILMLVANKRD